MQVDIRLTLGCKHLVVNQLKVHPSFKVLVSDESTCTPYTKENRDTVSGPEAFLLWESFGGESSGANNDPGLKAPGFKVST